MQELTRKKKIAKARKLAAKGKLWLNIAALYLAIIIIADKIWQYIKSPVWRLASVAGICVTFFVTTSFSPTSMVYGGDYSIVADQELELSSELDSDEYIETEVNSDDDMASLDDLIVSQKPYDIEPGTEAETVATEQTVEEVPQFDKSDWKLLLVNKQHTVPDDYTFTLGTIKGSMKCDERIIEPLTKMFTAAKQDGVNLIVCSPYRDLSRQEYLFDRKMKTYINSGYSYMDAYKESSAVVTVPGASEHQIGLAVDLICDNYSQLNEGFADTAAGKWLNENSYKYGFILRYPADKEDITGIIYEPWHFRYVGVDAATVIHDRNICLEEFIQSL